MVEKENSEATRGEKQAKGFMQEDGGKDFKRE